ncbi:MAG: HAMP domain-containing sensor histidine kinase, partial [Cyclobacteriaceae bacterium]
LFFGYTLFIVLKQKRLSEVQRDFINNMTHEFKTPLSTLKLSVEALHAESLSERGNKYIEIIGLESERLQNHVSRLLETNVKSKEYLFVEIDINKICKSVFQSFAIKQKESWEIALTDTPLIISGNQELVEMILLNLLDNAQKYGDGYVKMQTESVGNKAIINVYNRGGFIPKSEYKKIFQKFYRVSHGNTHDVKGFGLGLSIVKKSVKLLKGTIHLESDHTGTCFTIKLPKV